MIARDDLPPTPDWHDPRCTCPEARIGTWVGDWIDISTRADPPAHEAQPLTWQGDDS